MNEYIVAIDSGGTRTNVSLRLRDDPAVIHSFESGDVLSGSLPPQAYAATLSRILAPLESAIPDSSPDTTSLNVFIGAAGYAASTRDAFQDAIYQVAPHFLDGAVAAAGAANDAVALVLGHHVAGAVIAGTGSNVLVKTGDGQLHQAGGHGWVACDYGSGFWIGLRAIRQACREFEAGEDSVLLTRLRQTYGIRSGDDRNLVAKLRDLSVSDETMKPEVARLAAAICDAAERGDATSQNIVKQEAEDLADSAASALRRHFDRPDLAMGLTLVQCGSLLFNDFYRSAFEAQIHMRLLSGGTDTASVAWHRVKTGTAALFNLADALSGDTSDLMKVDLAFRPVIVRLR